MHVLKVVWLLLAAAPCLIRGLMGGKPTNIRNKILQAILLDQRYPLPEATVDKRAFSVIHKKPGIADECCPSITESVSLRGGLSRDRRLLELYRDHKTQQRFYQTRCLAGVANKPCRFLNPSDVISRCVQQHTYMYAIVKDYKIDEPYRLDYIRVKSGCACVVNPRSKGVNLVTVR
ncbi:uncharacterized protein LOC135473374 [Liolophura sinensis]|uniref:uncharacterized protein LOC135473374 n=1 Tax=Liolophura sinensis TaxID=3198878 RepID=UPI0031595F88